MNLFAVMMDEDVVAKPLTDATNEWSPLETSTACVPSSNTSMRRHMLSVGNQASPKSF
jgi:hypothetical protein